MKKKLIWSFLVLLVVAGIAGLAAKNRGPKATEVQVAKVGREDLQAKVSANGKIQAQKKVDISATIAGQITNIAVEEGDPVTKGQLLLQIDPVSPRAQVRGSEASIDALKREVDSARASLEQFRADFRRAEGNFAAGIVPAADLERTRTVVATAEAAVKVAERRVVQASAGLEETRDLLAKTTIRSPMDGVVTARRVEEGEVAVIGIQNSPGTVLLQISDMSAVEAEIEVDETSIPNVALGQEVRIRLDAYPNKTFRGTVTEVASSPILSGANQAIKFEVKVRLDAPPAGIKPGLSTRADILTGFRGDALVVPLQALVVREVERPPGQKVDPNAPRDQEGVYLMENGKARFQPIQTGMLGELSIEVLSGLKGGETLITGPFKALRELEPGGVVKVEDPKKKKKSGGAEPEKNG